MQDRPTRELARQWDARDPLNRFRKLFPRPAGQIYLDGDSLGLCSQEAERALLRALNEWKTKANESWTAPGGWLDLTDRLAGRVAALLGAAPDQVVIGNTTAANLHQLLATIYRRQFHRPNILIDGYASVSDRAVFWSHLELRGLDPQRQLLALPAKSDRLFDEARIEEAMTDPTLQMAVFPSVVWTTGQLLDVERICRAARRHGVLIGLDLSHSLGIMPHTLDEWDADFAFWSHSGFTAAGPGALAGLYLNRRHFESAAHAGLDSRPGRNGEEGNDDAQETRRLRGAAALQLGPAPILSLAPLDGALRPIEEAGLARIRAKSLDLTHFLRCAIEVEIPALQFVSPHAPECRGGHVVLQHDRAKEICRELRAHGLSAGQRGPDLLCLAPAPLCNSFVECWDAVQILRRILEQQTGAEFAAAGELVS